MQPLKKGEDFSPGASRRNGQEESKFKFSERKLSERQKSNNQRN
jgi:hypothetical protein